MSDQEKISRSRQWFELAQADLEAARAVYNQGIYNVACFLSQQATEKACKGLLTASYGTHERVHAIGSMLSKLPPDEQIEKLDPERLDKFYLATRYPESHAPETRIIKAFGKRDAIDAIDTASGMLSLTLTWAKECGVSLTVEPEKLACSGHEAHLKFLGSEDKWISMKVYADESDTLKANLQITENGKVISHETRLPVTKGLNGELRVLDQKISATIQPNRQVQFFEGETQVRGQFAPKLKAKAQEVTESEKDRTENLLAQQLSTGKNRGIAD